MPSLFDSISAETSVSKKEFRAAEAELRNELVVTQQSLRKAGVPVMVVFAGVDGAGKHEMVNRLNAWMDPRWIVTHAYTPPNESERQRPPFWRYWRDTPAQGQIGLYLSAWYSQPLLDRVRRRISDTEFESCLREIATFEKTLQDNGVLLIKVWMHLNKKAQRKRLEELASDPETEWLVKPGAWENWGLYSRFMEASETIVKHSRDQGTDWLLVDGRDEYGRTLAVANALRDAIRDRLTPPPQHQGGDR